MRGTFTFADQQAGRLGRARDLLNRCAHKMTRLAHRIAGYENTKARAEDKIRKLEQRNLGMDGLGTMVQVAIALYGFLPVAIWALDALLLHLSLKFFVKQMLGDVMPALITLTCFLFPGLIVILELSLSMTRDDMRKGDDGFGGEIGSRLWTLTGVVLALSIPVVGVATVTAIHPAAMSPELLLAIRLQAFAFAAMSFCGHCLLLFSIRGHAANAYALYACQRGFYSRQAARAGRGIAKAKIPLMREYSRLEAIKRTYLNEFSNADSAEVLDMALLDMTTIRVVNAVFGRKLLSPPPETELVETSVLVPHNTEEFRAQPEEEEEEEEQESEFTAAPKTKPGLGSAKTSDRRVNGSGKMALTVLAAAIMAASQATAAVPSPYDKAAVAAFMAGHRDGGKNPFLADSAGKNCEHLTKMYRKALKRSGVEGREVERYSPHCQTLAQGLEALTGRPVYWAGCFLMAFDPVRADECVAGLRRARHIDDNHLRDPKKYIRAVERGMRDARPDDNLPATWRRPDHRVLRIGPEEKACAGYSPSGGHIKQCLGEAAEDLKSCETRRGVYEGRLELAYGGMPYGYRPLSCTEIAQALAAPPLPVQAPPPRITTYTSRRPSPVQSDPTVVSAAPPQPVTHPKVQSGQSSPVAAVPNDKPFMRPLQQLTGKLMPSQSSARTQGQIDAQSTTTTGPVQWPSWLDGFQLKGLIFAGLGLAAVLVAWRSRQGQRGGQWR